ncbi:MAG TPA: hypothetical protein VGM69_07880 [Chloroflexota bacterium]
MHDITLMGQVALTRLRRRERIAGMAEQSHSPIWRRLARQAIAAAQQDCRLAGLNRNTVESTRRRTAARRAA